MIPEAYLHYLWKTKRLPFHRITNIDELPFELKNSGVHNTSESGPDFFAGRILFDGIDWSGNIEIHVKSSDWYKHNHHNDLAYDNVILHVVLENDREVFIHGKSIPTLELKEFIDWEHFNKWSALSKFVTEINCAKSCENIDEIYFERMLENTLIQRLNRKAYLLVQDSTLEDPAEMLYFLISRAFGTKVNQQPFEELAYRLPLSLLKSIHREKQIALIHATSGIYEQDDSCSASIIENPLKRNKIKSTIAPFVWKRKGLRPSGFPEIRIKQFAHLVASFDFHSVSNSLNLGNLKRELDAAIQRSEKFSTPFGNGFKDLLIINCIVPYLWWRSEKEENVDLREIALNLLEATKPEQNSILKHWKAIGLKITSAYESQGYIELYTDFCSKNKCLSCEVGIQILK